MPIVVEDGTMPAGANSYASLEQADAYLVPRGLWPQTPIEEADDAAMVTKKESALMRSADYLNGLSWKSQQVDEEWHMAWPRKAEVAIQDKGMPMIFVRVMEGGEWDSATGGYQTVEAEMPVYGLKTAPTLEEVQGGVFASASLIVLLAGKSVPAVDITDSLKFDGHKSCTFHMAGRQRKRGTDTGYSHGIAKQHDRA